MMGSVTSVLRGPLPRPPRSPRQLMRHDDSSRAIEDLDALLVVARYAVRNNSTDIVYPNLASLVSTMESMIDTIPGRQNELHARIAELRRILHLPHAPPFEHEMPTVSPLESMEQGDALEPDHTQQSAPDIVSQEESPSFQLIDNIEIPMPPPFQPLGLTAEETERWLPVKSYIHSSQDQDTLCCICLSDINNGEEVRQLPCRHDIHKSCLDLWLKEHSCCPLCRRNLRGDK